MEELFRLSNDAGSGGGGVGECGGDMVECDYIIAVRDFV